MRDVEQRGYRHLWEWPAQRRRETKFHWKFIDAFRHETERKIEYGVKIVRTQFIFTWVRKPPN